MCACPGDMLTFTCTIVGGGATVWSGTALECALRDIVLRHDIFKQGIVSYCDGAIVIESVGIEGNCYISLLNITASAQFDNKSTECLVNDAGTSSIGDSIITLVPGTLFASLTMINKVSNSLRHYSITPSYNMHYPCHLPSILIRISCKAGFYLKIFCLGKVREARA